MKALPWTAPDPGRSSPTTMRRISMSHVLTLETPDLAPRVLRDCVGTEWVVTEVRPLVDVGRMGRYQPHPERRQGWLLFEADDGERRRLAPYPADWRTVTNFELERWCMRAQRAGSGETRRLEDCAVASRDDGA